MPVANLLISLSKETDMSLGALLAFGMDKTQVLFKAQILSGQDPDIVLIECGHLITINNRIYFQLAVMVEVIPHAHLSFTRDNDVTHVWMLRVSSVHSRATEASTAPGKSLAVPGSVWVPRGWPRFCVPQLFR